MGLPKYINNQIDYYIDKLKCDTDAVSEISFLYGVIAAQSDSLGEEIIELIEKYFGGIIRLDIDDHSFVVDYISDYFSNILAWNSERNSYFMKFSDMIYHLIKVKYHIHKIAYEYYDPLYGSETHSVYVSGKYIIDLSKKDHSIQTIEFPFDVKLNEESNNHFFYLYKSITIQNWAYSRIAYKLIDKSKEVRRLLSIKACRMAEKRKYENKTYLSRLFPPSLRFVIFERDNYVCQICGKHKNNLPEDEHLEVDHIIEWEDGGETSYNNGQTVCSSCNKGKHHGKKLKKILQEVI